MSQSEQTYQNIGKQLNVDMSKMFGKPCLKIEGKTFAGFFQDEMVFKLAKEMHEKVMRLKGAQLWAPSGKNKPMKEWVQVPHIHHKTWTELAKAAMDYVKNQNK